jgi:hypothetical protein
MADGARRGVEHRTGVPGGVLAIVANDATVSPRPAAVPTPPEENVDIPVVLEAALPSLAEGEEGPRAGGEEHGDAIGGVAIGPRDEQVLELGRRRSAYGRALARIALGWSGDPSHQGE